MIKWMACGDKDINYSNNSFMNDTLTMVYRNARGNFNEIVDDFITGMSLTVV